MGFSIALNPAVRDSIPSLSMSKQQTETVRCDIAFAPPFDKTSIHSISSFSQLENSLPIDQQHFGDRSHPFPSSMTALHWILLKRSVHGQQANSHGAGRHQSQGDVYMTTIASSTSWTNFEKATQFLELLNCLALEYLYLHLVATLIYEAKGRLFLQFL